MNGFANGLVYLSAFNATPVCLNTTQLFNESALYNYTNNTQTINNRRLLQASTEVGLCLTGTFSKTGGVCGGCPLGASTQFPWNGLTDGSACACLPGSLWLHSLAHSMAHSMAHLMPRTNAQGTRRAAMAGGGSSAACHARATRTACTPCPPTPTACRARQVSAAFSKATQKLLKRHPNAPL